MLGTAIQGKTSLLGMRWDSNRHNETWLHIFIAMRWVTAADALASIEKRFLINFRESAGGYNLPCI
jgi:hypothetical protein